MKSLLKEPLFHFVLIAALIFGAHTLWMAEKSRRANTIYISTADMERMGALYTAEAGTLPNPTDVQAMIADHVRNEALAREARHLGLDQDDTIIERRLAQKMTFMVADLEEERAASEETLRDWYETNPDNFRTPARISFRHVFLSANKPARAEKIMKDLNSAEDIDWRKTGDAFMLQRSYADLPARELVRLFGAEFSSAMRTLPDTDQWQGPVTSALGEHIVRIDARTPAQLPPFEDIRTKVETDWKDAQRRQHNADAITRIISKYEVEIEGLEDE